MLVDVRGGVLNSRRVFSCVFSFVLLSIFFFFFYL
jgi:hypothetical protein